MKHFLSLKNLNLVSLFLFLLLESCKDNPVNIESSFFSGITVTNENGIILSDDSSDWQPRYESMGMDEDSLYFLPAYQNPAGEKFVSINPPDSGKLGFILVYVLPNQSNVKITFNNTPDNTLFKLVDTVQFAGLYKLFFDLTDKTKEELPNGIYRIYFEKNEFKSYGDIEINW